MDVTNLADVKEVPKNRKNLITIELKDGIKKEDVIIDMPCHLGYIGINSEDDEPVNIDSIDYTTGTILNTKCDNLHVGDIVKVKLEVEALVMERYIKYTDSMGGGG